MYALLRPLLTQKRLLVFALFLVVGGCASSIPKEIRTPPIGDLQLAQVLREPQRHVGERVRWGGEIVAVENTKRETRVILVAKPLDYSGRPEDTDFSPGRFLARFQGFRDPATYKEGRALTVAGVLEPAVTRPVGDYPYRYPVVAAQTGYLWPPLPEYLPAYYWYPYCSPFYGPYYDPWCYPWYGPPYRRYVW